MKICVYFISLTLFLTSTISFAEPNGAVLYRNGKRLGYHKVPSTAGHHYFGYLEGPALENKYSAFRYYIDQDDRNAIDIIGKFKEESILQHFSDTSVDEHASWPWGTDILKIGSSMGLGAFRLFANNAWLNPQLPEKIDSLVVLIQDSSVQTPSVQVRYYGWNIGNGIKISVFWTIATNYDERPVNCEVAIIGTYTGKVVIGLVNHRDNTSNPNRSSVQLIQQQNPPLLATLGKQGGLQEGFADSLLMAIYADKSYFDSFVNNGTTNYGMVLKPDQEQKVKWSIVYSWVREANPLFRNPDWEKTLFIPTASIHSYKYTEPAQKIQQSITPMDLFRVRYTISGRTIGGSKRFDNAAPLKTNGLYIIERYDGITKKTNTISAQVK
jgi:hypothetical protein